MIGETKAQGGLQPLHKGFGMGEIVMAEVRTKVGQAFLFSTYDVKGIEVLHLWQPGDFRQSERGHES